MTFVPERVKAYLAKALVILRQLQESDPQSAKNLASEVVCAYLNWEDQRLAAAAARIRSRDPCRPAAIVFSMNSPA